MEQFLKEAKKSTKIISTLSGNVKNQILNEMAEALIINSDKIIQENQKDILANHSSLKLIEMQLSHQ